MHVIKIHNKSGHDQTFEVHGWNKNKNITVHAGKTSSIDTPDGSSGAIIALHDGHEGEQVEVTKTGYGGNDFFDVSNIVGAGGNITAMHAGEKKTLKGDANFMQHMNTAWHKASQDLRNKLKGRVFTDSHGKVKRIGPIKDSPELEKLVRTFADGKTYIGVGAWNGNPGNSKDNEQSSAAKGNKDILVTYSDGDASPDSGSHPKAKVAATAQTQHVQNAKVHEDSAHKKEHNGAGHNGVHQNGDKKSDHHQGEAKNGKHKASSHSDGHKEAEKKTEDHKSAHVSGEQKTAQKGHKPGIILTNKSHEKCTYVFYDNYWNGNGEAGANFDHPLKSVELKAGASTHVPLPTSFKGRVQRGKDLPATWVEFQISASNDHAAHGDISLQQGCDGAATIASTDGSNRKNGFTNDILKGAPAAACAKKPDGSKALATTVGNWTGGPNKAAIDYLNKVVGQTKAYIVGGSGTDDVASKNQCLAVDMY